MRRADGPTSPSDEYGRFRRRRPGPVRLAAVGAVLVVALLAEGCALPSSGPDARSILENKGWINKPFAVIDVTDGILNALAFRDRPSLAARFGRTGRTNDIRIVAGDVISVALWEAPPGTLFNPPAPTTEKLGPASGGLIVPTQSVGTDGTILVPYAGRMNVLGQTPASVERQIGAALASKAVQPQALVEVQRSERNTVTVTGEVAAGARVPVTAGGERVLDVIAAAGGLRAPVKESVVELARGTRTARAAFEDIVADPREDVYVRPGDVVTVIREPRTFTVLGATNHNAEIQFDAPEISMAKALALAGGLEDSRADPSGIFVFRLEQYAVACRLLAPNDPLLVPHGLTPIVYRFDLLKPSVMAALGRFWVQPNDLIYVSNASGAQVQKFFNITQGTIGNTLTAGAIIATAVRY